MSDEMTFDEAVAYISNALKNFDKLTESQQAQIRGFAAEYTAYMEQEKLRERELRIAESKRRSQQYADRKERIRQHVPKWCEENLQPGMIIKVQAKNEGWRKVLSVKPGQVLKSGFEIVGDVRTQHVAYRRTRDPETREVSWTLTEGDYITNHTLTNVKGVVLRTDSTGKPIVTSVLELAEGVNET